MRFLFLAVLSTIPCFSAIAGSPVTFDVQATFNYPGATSTLAFGINDNGEVAGYFLIGDSTYRGFVRYRDHFSGPIIHPDDQRDSTRLTSINNAGTVCGYYQQTDFHWHSFVATGSTFTEINPGAPDTYVYGLNDAGNVCGYTALSGFVIINGTVSYFNVPGADYTTPTAINNLNQCVGFYAAGTGYAGFLRDADGTLIYPISAAGSMTTFLSGINDQGTMVGSAYDSADIGHAVLVQLSGRTARYDYPDATATGFWGINSRHQITGIYGDASGFNQNLIVKARPAATE